MRVLHVIPSIAPRYGGPSTAIAPMTEALNRLPDLRVEIAATDANGTNGRLAPASFQGGPTPIHLFRTSFSERWKCSAGLWKWLHGHAREYDLLHVHALWSFSTTAACSAARRHRLPLIIRPCGMLSPYTWRRSAWKKRLYWKAVERRNLMAAHCFHVTSRAEASDLSGLGLTAPAVVIPQGVDAQAWRLGPRPDLLRRRCGARAGDRPIVLFLSRLHPKKGIVDFLLPAFSRLKTDAFLALAGGPDEHEPGYETQVRSAVSRLGLESRVALLGPVSVEERWSLFDGAALFVLPSHSENFGLVVTEAMARGCAVVVSEAVQAGEHVTRAGAGRVVPLEVEALAASLEELLSRPSVAAEMGEHGRRYVCEHLTWDRVARDIAAMYRKCSSQ